MPKDTPTSTTPPGGGAPVYFSNLHVALRALKRAAEVPGGEPVRNAARAWLAVENAVEVTTDQDVCGAICSQIDDLTEYVSICRATNASGIAVRLAAALRMIQETSGGAVAPECMSILAAALADLALQLHIVPEMSLLS